MRFRRLSFFQVNPHADMETVFQSTGICGSPWRGNSLGSLLWNRNNFAFPRAEGQICPWCGNRFGSHREMPEENARLNKIDNIEFFVGKAEEVLPREYEKNGVYADVIVVDPPRKGCDEMLAGDDGLKMQPGYVMVYVSCDSATLARDLKYLCERGYELRKVCPVDQFGMTVHVETVVGLQRKDT